MGENKNVDLFKTTVLNGAAGHRFGATDADAHSSGSTQICGKVTCHVGMMASVSEAMYSDQTA